MGNSQNKQDSSTPKKSLAEIIDYVAANYILTQNFEDMTKLSDMGYCNKLVILTSKIIANSLSNLEVEYLAQRLKGDEEVNYMDKDNVIFLNTANLPNLDVRNQTQKRRLCIGIAKHYVKVAHLFAAISTTINPTYSHTDASGQSITSSLAEKQSIPEHATVTIKRINICNKRIDALVNNQDFSSSSSSSSSSSGDITVKPSFCHMNSVENPTLSNEPGIPELEKLYYDKYDYDHGDFIGMTDTMRADVYEKDVANFYKAFTGKDIPLDNKGKKTITKFSQIPLKDFHKLPGCKPEGLYNKSSGYKGSLKDKLFKDYADHVKTMMNVTTENQNKLLEIIDILFVFNTNILTNKKEIVVSPTLTEKKLQTIIEMARKLIIELYITCENDFLKGLEIFEAIVEKQIIDTSKEQIKMLETSIDTTLASNDISTETPLTETEEKTEEKTEENVVDETDENVAETEENVAETDETKDVIQTPTFEDEVEKEIENTTTPTPTTASLPTPTTASLPTTTTASLPTTTTASLPLTTKPIIATASLPPTTKPIIATNMTILPSVGKVDAVDAVKSSGGTRKKKRKYFKKTRKSKKRY